MGNEHDNIKIRNLSFEIGSVVFPLLGEQKVKEAKDKGRGA